MSTSGIPTGVMRFKMEVMKKDNSFTTIAPPNVTKICIEGRWGSGDTIHGSGYITYLDSYGNAETLSDITIEMGVITIYTTEVIESYGINFVTCP